MGTDNEIKKGRWVDFFSLQERNRCLVKKILQWLVFYAVDVYSRFLLRKQVFKKVIKKLSIFYYFF